MIVKTLRCKKKDFVEMLSYVWVSHEAPEESIDTFSMAHNLRSSKIDDIVKAFSENDKYRKKRSNGVVMYHEILSFSPKDRDSISIDILREVSQKYISLRNENALCICRPHFDKGHVHLHFVFSGTEYKSSKTLRLDNKEFRKIRVEMERFQKTMFPELKHSIVYDGFENKKTNKKQQDRNTRKQREIEMKKRLGKSKFSEKDQFVLWVNQEVKKAKLADDFYKALKGRGADLYMRKDKVNGLISKGGRKYRFTSLLDAEGKIQFNQIQENSQEYQKRLDQVRSARQESIEKDREK